MSLWNPVSILQGLFPFSQKQDMARKSRRWRNAATVDPALAVDLIQLGGVLAGQPARLVDGWPTPALPDPQARDYAAGRRDMALQLLALMNLTPSKLQALMKEADYDDE